MKRVVLSSYGSRGDVEPVVALALRLRELGAEVRLCVPPDFAELVGAAGLPMVALAWPIRALATGRVPGKTSLPDIAAELTALADAAVIEAAGTEAAGTEVADGGTAADGVRDLAVVATGSLPAVAGARAAAERLGAAWAFAALSTSYLPSPHQAPAPWPGQEIPAEGADNRTLWDLNSAHLQALFGPTVNAHRASVGLPAVDGVRDHVHGDHPLLATDPVLGPWRETSDLDVTQTGAWLRTDERPLPADLVEFLAAGSAPVYVGFGSMPLRGADPAAVSRAVVAAARARGRRVLLGSGWAGLAPVDEGDDVLVVGDVNHQALFRRVAAVVHHGGAGTTVTAAGAGVPQVLVPQVADQPYWAGRVAGSGIGVAHDGPVPTAESLTAALTTALSPTVRERAAALAPSIRTDGAAVAAKLVLDGARPV
ncbi:glycosyltransferase [Streptomyces sp. NPDC091281]|uniref:glycosyltransferase n=1 Tax=Streptomyces sp. NPDC091281 TaxID=3365985 RepID=UPI0038052ABE